MALISSMLAPTVYSLLNVNEEVIVLMDTSEEEKSEKTEKDAEEKILQWDFSASSISECLPKNPLNTFYLNKDYSFLEEILLPPPKHTL